MNTLTFISNLADSLAWPATITLLIWIFRSPIGGAIDKVTKIKFQNTEINLGKIEEALEAVAVNASPASKDGPTTKLDSLALFATETPNLQPIALRLEIEKYLRDIAGAVKIDKGKDISELLSELFGHKIINAETRNAFHTLIEYGNQVACGAPVDPRTIQATNKYRAQIIGGLHSELTMRAGKLIAEYFRGDSKATLTETGDLYDFREAYLSAVQRAGWISRTTHGVRLTAKGKRELLA